MITVIPDERYQTIVEGMVKRATGQILLATFKIQDSDFGPGKLLHEVITAVCEKSRRGVKVCFLMNWEKRYRGVARTNMKVADTFRAAGVDVRFLPGGRCVHAKILLVDRTCMILGSHNWSVKSWTANFEMSMLTDDEAAIRDAEAAYQKVFSTAQRWL